MLDQASAMLHGFEGKECLLSVGMLRRPMWFWESPVSMFFERLSRISPFQIAWTWRPSLAKANSMLHSLGPGCLKTVNRNKAAYAIVRIAAIVLAVVSHGYCNRL